MRWPSRTELLALVVGVAHAALVLGVALRYGYDVGPNSYPLHVTVWRYVGLVALAALPVWLALEDRLILPMALVALLALLAFHAELTPPDPTFRDVAELEPAVTEPTGYTVVENGLYLVKYASAWYVWTVGAMLVGLWEHLVRARKDWLPDPAIEAVASTDRGDALLLAASAGLAHALASVGFGWTLGMSGGFLGVAWSLVGGVLLLGVPVYVLVRHDLVWPTAVATLMLVNSVHSQQYAGPGDPHALYAYGWFFFLGVALLPGLVEYGLREVGRRAETVPG